MIATLTIFISLPIILIGALTGSFIPLFGWPVAYLATRKLDGLAQQSASVFE